MKEYKVLAQSDSFWRDRFNPQTLQAALNEHAREGWQVITCATSEFTAEPVNEFETVRARI